MTGISFHVSDKIVIAGYSGAGKSTLLQYFITHVFQNFRHTKLIVVDPTARFSVRAKKTYNGTVKCLEPRKNKICIKISGEERYEALIARLNKYYDPTFLVTDEVDGYIRTNYLPYNFGIYSEQGRNWNQGGCFTVRRLGALNKSILSNAHYLILFQVRNRMDRMYLESILDVDIDRLFGNLGEHDFAVIDMHLSKLLGIYRLSGNKLIKSGLKPE